MKEPLHSAPGLPDAGLILKKLPVIGKRKINQAFFEGEKTEKAWQEGKRKRKRKRKWKRAKASAGVRINGEE